MKNSKKAPHLARSKKTFKNEKSRKHTFYCKSKSDRSRKNRFKSETSISRQSSCSQPDKESCIINQEKLQMLEKMFEKTADAAGALDMKGFQKVMKETFSSVTDETLDSLFWKVDVDCDGRVSWHKYLDYLMRDFKGKEEKAEDQYRLRLQPPMKIIPLNHGHEIVKLQFLASQFQGSSGRFLTVTKDGILQFWDESFMLLQTVHLDQSHRRHNLQMWVNDMVCLTNINLIAIASTDQDLEFFDISGNKCQKTFIFIDLDSCAVVMDYWTDQHKAVFCVGDTKGNVLIFVSDDVAESGLFHPYIFQTKGRIDLQRPESGSSYIKISMQNLLTKKSKIHRSYRLKAIHANWCQQIKFIPELNVVASCSDIDSTAMVLIIVPTRADHPKTSTMTLRKGILCFDYCPDRNFLVTGGYDPIILLWNPLFIKKPIWQMKGHQTSVTHVIVNGKSNCIISISRDKNIRLWYIHNLLCFQSFSGKFFALGNHPITCAYFHKANDTFVCGTYSIGILTGYLEAQEGTWKIQEVSTTHHTVVCGVLYSKTVKQVVSGSLNGLIRVWELVTGKKVKEFPVSESKDVELTAMALDELERCLLTGMRNGTVKMWNYNLGVCLLNFPNPDQMEINGIIHVNGIFYVAGWNKRITWYLYQNKEVIPLFDHWPYFHTDDILCLAKYHSNILGSASYNGDIFIWNVSWGKPFVHFNASKGPLALKPIKVFKEEDRVTLADLVNKNTGGKKSWAKKSLWRPISGASSQTQKHEIRRNLASAPPALRYTEGKSAKELSIQSKLQKPCSGVNSKPVNGMRPQSKTWSKNKQKENDDYTRQKEKKDTMASVEKIIFLPTRLRTPRTATLLSSAGNGYIYAWSIHDRGGMLGKFQPAENQYQDSIVGAMASDEKDWILITGDSKGYLKIWDIKDYCRLPTEQKISLAWEEKLAQENIYRNLIPTHNRVETQQELPETEEVFGGHVVSLIPPELLISWQAHDKGVTNIAFGEHFHVIISAGADFNVKAWKISGEAIGTFGLSIWRRLVPTGTIDYSPKSSFVIEPTEMPEIKEVSDKHDDYTKILTQQRKDQRKIMSLLHSKSPEAMDKLRKLAEQSMLGSVEAGEGVEDSWIEWETSGILRSDIVGKAYKPKDRRRIPKVEMTPVKFLKEKEISPWVYKNLPCKDLQDLSRSNMAIMKTTQTPRKKNVWLITQHMIKNLSVARQFMDTPTRSQSFSFSSPLLSKNSSFTSLSSLKLSAVSSVSSLKQSSISSATAASKKQLRCSLVSPKKKAPSSSTISIATKSSMTISTVSSVKSSTLALKPLKSILKG
ncbi:EF-hand calcium-binding domain-containing protein 8 [Antechinus flavipes]|uniref:EF-hand calcium-binding domain-containing protein 8 n=1 Tax=Antechinus flavipes TaxID=38775 RepID=UPI0022356C49|nr:EF-hand calcium-binding domain-containing protein 8 [Antechinus flavipes]